MRTKSKPDENGSTTRKTTSVKLSVNVSVEIGERLRRIAFEERLSESSIVEIALVALFVETEDRAVGTFLRENGASLRRAGGLPH